ncbi:MAG: DUF3047 domain-containing protein [Bacteroidota bacterium]
MKRLLILLAFLCYSQHTDVYAQQSDSVIVVPVTSLETETLMLVSDDIEYEAWRLVDLPKRNTTSYEKIEIDGKPAVRGIASGNSASGIFYKLDVDPVEYPILEWQWRIDQVLSNGDLTKKDGDDYAARIYITFDYDRRKLSLRDRVKYAAIRTFTNYEIPLRALNYVWANKAEQGTIAPNPYTKWVYMVAAESGNTNAKTWNIGKANILEDYKKAFGDAPPRINGIAIMTDSDNTRETSVGYYGDIILRKK